MNISENLDKSLVFFLKNTRPGEMPDHSAVLSGVAKAFQATLPVEVSRISSLINTKLISSSSSNSHLTFLLLFFFQRTSDQTFWCFVGNYSNGHIQK
jgi:hypothetical protein